MSVVLDFEEPRCRRSAGDPAFGFGWPLGRVIEINIPLPFRFSIHLHVYAASVATDALESISSVG